jgi:hypothetical protein
VGQERLGPSYFFISLVTVPLNSLVWYHAASGWRIHCGVEVTELSTNKQHTLSRTSLKVYMELDSYSKFLFRDRALFIGTQFSNLYTAVDTPAEAVWLCVCVCV